MTSIIEDDYYDTCANCGKKQNAVSNLQNELFKIHNHPKCGHKFCSSCIDRELYRKRQFECPRCKTMVTQDKLTIKSIEESEVERDYSIRRKICSLFNKKETDFKSVNEFKNYEEMVEDIIYNLVHYIDVDNMNKVIEKYKSDNRHEISLNEYRRNELLKEESILIKNKETAMLNDNLKFQDNYYNELLLKKQSKIQMNSMMLGESDPIISQEIMNKLMNNTNITSNTINTNINNENNENNQLQIQISSKINPVLSYLNTRDLPKLLTTKDTNHSKKLKTKQDLIKMHQAGGYQYSEYDKKNTFEIYYQFKEYY